MEILGLREPHMRRWVDLMAHHGGGEMMSFNITFFMWLLQQIIMIEDYPYAGTNFKGDP